MFRNPMFHWSMIERRWTYIFTPGFFLQSGFLFCPRSFQKHLKERFHSRRKPSQIDTNKSTRSYKICRNHTTQELILQETRKHIITTYLGGQRNGKIIDSSVGRILLGSEWDIVFSFPGGYLTQKLATSDYPEGFFQQKKYKKSGQNPKEKYRILPVPSWISGAFAVTFWGCFGKLLDQDRGPKVVFVHVLIGSMGLIYILKIWILNV